MKSEVCKWWWVGLVIFWLHGKSLGEVPSSEPLVGGFHRRSGWRLTSGTNEGTGGFVGGCAKRVDGFSCGVPGFMSRAAHVAGIDGGSVVDEPGADGVFELVDALVE